MRSSSEHGQDLFFDHVIGDNLLTWWLFSISFMELLLPWTWIESRFNLSCEAFGRTNYVCVSKVRVIETCHCWLFHCFLVLCISHEVQIFLQSLLNLSRHRRFGVQFWTASFTVLIEKNPINNNTYNTINGLKGENRKKKTYKIKR